MKKLFAIITITSFLAACNGKTEESTTTTTTKDTVSTDSPLMDAEITADSVNKKIHDSTSSKMVDTMMNK